MFDLDANNNNITNCVKGITNYFSNYVKPYTNSIRQLSLNTNRRIFNNNMIGFKTRAIVIAYYILLISNMFDLYAQTYIDFDPFVDTKKIIKNYYLTMLFK
jgi:hypothetical protein